MLGLKQLVDTHFNDNWADTPVQFDGTKFPQDELTEWIGLKYSILSNEITSIDNACSKEEVLLEIDTYADTMNATLLLCDNVTKFMRNQTAFNVRTNISYSDTVQFGVLYSTTVRLTLYVMETTREVSYLVDGLGNFLTDGLGNLLVS